MILQCLNKRLSTECRRVRSLRQLDVHVTCQPINLRYIPFLQFILLKVVSILYDLKTVLEHKLNELVIYLKSFLDSWVVKMSEWFVDYLNSGWLMRPFYLDVWWATIEMLVVVLIKHLLTLVDVVYWFEGFQWEVSLKFCFVMVATLIALIELLLIREVVVRWCWHTCSIEEVVAIDVATGWILQIYVGRNLVNFRWVHDSTIAIQLAAILHRILLLILHGFSHFCLNKVLADFVNVYLR